MFTFIQSLPLYIPVGSAIAIVVVMGYLIVLYSITKVPIMSTGKKRYPLIFDYITHHVDIKQHPQIIDLGCSDGRFLREAERRGFPNGIGYDLSPFHIWKGKLINLLKGASVQLYRENFFHVDISDADILYVFLNNNIIREVSKKVEEEAKPGALTISLGLPLADLQPEHVQQLDGMEGNALYFYRISG